MNSSPLTSPSRFSAYEGGSRPSTPQPSPVPKKRARKKKETQKPKTTKKSRKQMIVNSSPGPVEDQIPRSPGERSPSNSRRDGKNQTTGSLHHDSLLGDQTRVEQPESFDPTKDDSSKQSETRSTPQKKIKTNGNIPNDIAIILSEEIDIAPLPEGSARSIAHRTASPTVTHELESDSRAAPESINRKSHHSINDPKPKKHKKPSLAEILAITNPKTKRGIQIGLPQEKKHRLHLNINPNPVVQKQVKKKLKLKRGEYDSGEDDPHHKNGASDEDDDYYEGQDKFKAENDAERNLNEVVNDDNDQEGIDDDEDYSYD